MSQPQIDILSTQHTVISVDVWELALSWFSSSKTTSKHSEFTVLRCSNCMVATRPVLSKNRQPYAWKCFVREQLLLDLNYLETPMQLTAVYFRGHTHKSTIHHLSRCQKFISKHRYHIFLTFLLTNRHELFLSNWQIVWDPMWTNIVYSQMFICTKLNVCWSH